MRMNNKILNTLLDTLENRKIWCHILVCQTKGCAKHFNFTHNINVLYPSNIISTIFMIYHFLVMKGIYCQCKFIHQLLFMCRVCTKRCIDIYKFFSWKPFIYQYHDMIILINTETKRIMENLKMQVLKDRSFLYSNLKIFFKNYSQFRKFCLIISSVENIISRYFKILHYPSQGVFMYMA